MAAYEVVCCARMGDRALAQHLVPLACCEDIDKLWIVRHAKIAAISIPKSEYVITDHRFKFMRYIQMLRACRRLARRPRVIAFVSFNPFPYGLFALWGARTTGRAVHFGFIGSDWHSMMLGRLGKWLLPYCAAA